MNTTLQVIRTASPFTSRDFVGGDAALDFINTVAGRDRSPRDRLDSYIDLLEWAAFARLVPERQLRALRRAAKREPTAAAAALLRAKVLREGMFALLTAVISGRAPSRRTLSLLRECWIAGLDAHELRVDEGRVVVELRKDAADLDLIASVVAYRLVQQVLPLPNDRLRICQGPDCAWLFFDSSKAGRRRWCDMSVCGNAAKSRRHHARAHRRT